MCSNLHHFCANFSHMLSSKPGGGGKLPHSSFSRYLLTSPSLLQSILPSLSRSFFSFLLSLFPVSITLSRYFPQSIHPSLISFPSSLLYHLLPPFLNPSLLSLSHNSSFPLFRFLSHSQFSLSLLSSIHLPPPLIQSFLFPPLQSYFSSSSSLLPYNQSLSILIFLTSSPSLPNFILLFPSFIVLRFLLFISSSTHSTLPPFLS